MKKKVVRQKPKFRHFAQRGSLHTDELEKKYGKISARVLRHDDQVREAHLVDKKGISRTYALTFFRRPFGTLAFYEIDREIQSGKPIGKTFREHGFEVRKNVVAVFVIGLPDWLREAFHDKRKFAKVRLSEFCAKKGSQNPVIYGTVAEVYPPDFRPAKINAEDLKQVHPLAQKMVSNGIPLKLIWDNLGETADWSQVQRGFATAKRESESPVNQLTRRVHRFISSK